MGSSYSFPSSGTATPFQSGTAPPPPLSPPSPLPPSSGVEKAELEGDESRLHIP